MAEDSYTEKEKLLLRKHELEWQNLKARRDLEAVRREGLISLGEITAAFGPDPFEVETAKLKESQSRELLALVKEKLGIPEDAEPKLPVEKSEGRKSETLKTRKALKKAYFSKFPQAMIIDVCWAARQHRREWDRWIKGEIKNGSKPDRIFRSVLTGNKAPSEIRPEERPKEWK